jgi:hypothetical protein
MKQRTTLEQDQLAWSSYCRSKPSRAKVHAYLMALEKKRISVHISSARDMALGSSDPGVRPHRHPEKCLNDNATILHNGRGVPGAGRVPIGHNPRSWI